MLRRPLSIFAELSPCGRSLARSFADLHGRANAQVARIQRELHEILPLRVKLSFDR